MEFKDKVVFITGGSSGIGKEAGIQFAKEGAKVILTDLNEEGGLAVVEEITSSGGFASFSKLEASDYDAIGQVIQEIVETHGRLDIGINNAGIGSKALLKTADADHDDWHKIIAVNQTGVFYCMQHEIRQMLKQGSGSIINTASIAGLRGLPNNAAYVASKHAVVGMTKTAAMEYAKSGIRINALCPVFTKTNLFNPDVFPPEIVAKFKASIPMKRFAHVSEMADAILWLCSDRASFVTGLALPIDGGLTAY